MCAYNYRGSLSCCVFDVLFTSLIPILAQTGYEHLYIMFFNSQGLINAAEALKLKLEGEGILHRAFHRYPVRAATE